MRKNSKKQNDGAWYRANRFLKFCRENPNDANVSAFFERLHSDAALIAAVGIMRGVCANLAGMNSTAFEGVAVSLGFGSSSSQQLAVYLASGFPRTVWSGHLANDNNVPVAAAASYPSGYYDKDGVLKVNDKTYTVYVPQNAPAWRQASHTLREKFAAGVRVYRQMLDIANADSLANPGGVADAAPPNTNGGV